MFETPKTDDRNLTQARDTAVTDEDFIPVYARGGRSATGAAGGKMKTWMILVPLGVLVVGGITTLVMTSGEQAPIAPLAEPAFTAPVLSSAAAPVEAADAPVRAAQSTQPVTQTGATPAARESTPTPVRRPASVRRAEPSVAPPVVRAPVPVTPNGPQPYAPAPTATPPAARAAVPAPATTRSPAPPPTIIIAPAG